MPDGIVPNLIAADPAQWILPGSATLAVVADMPLTAAVDHFAAHPQSCLLPVVDADGRVIGAVREADVRRLLFNPFGHALLRNPAYAQHVTALMRPCPMAEVTDAVATILAVYGRATIDDGMVLTRDGRLAGVVPNRMLVRVAAAREHDWALAQAARVHRMTDIALRFDREASALADLMTRVGDDMLAAARTAAGRAHDSAGRMVTVAETAARTDRDIETLAMAAHGLASALGELRSESADARAITRDAVAATSVATMRTGELATAARSIDRMLALIQSVATKVNRLALNATIEAARAGPAGRSFAVVAGEVKTLAAQTKAAATEIGGQIAAILTMVDQVATGQAAMRDVVATVDQLTGSVDATVGAQRAVIEHVTGSADAARAASHTISTVFVAVRQETQHALTHCGQMQAMAEELAANAARLRGTVGTLLDQMRAA
jgi:methyl-accepting chemotaxis protein